MLQNTGEKEESLLRAILCIMSGLLLISNRTKKFLTSASWKWYFRTASIIRQNSLFSKNKGYEFNSKLNSYPFYFIVICYI
jgi:hypothetical protein